MLIDKLGRPLKVGDTIITKGYCSFNMDTIVKVQKIAKVNIYVELPNPYGRYYKYTRKDIPNLKRLARNPQECIIINEQIKYNQKAWPELYI